MEIEKLKLSVKLFPWNIIYEIEPKIREQMKNGPNLT